MIDEQQGEPTPFVYFPTPGLTLLGQAPNGDFCRGLYRASNGDLYGAFGLFLYWIDSRYVFHKLGTFTNNSSNPVMMSDNGTNLIICDGSVLGWTVVMASHANFTPIPTGGLNTDGTTQGWLGSNYLDFSDTFFIANSPGTPSFYISESESVDFDALQFAGKSAKPDLLLAAVVSHRVIWLIGVSSTEIFYDSGGNGLGTTPSGNTVNTFPYEIMPGVSIEHGCIAQYSIAKANTEILWLAQSLIGKNYVLLGSGYQIQRVSNHAVEEQWNSYSTTSDCIAYTYLQDGHDFYVMNFPTADKTWVYDLGTKLWHERCWLDSNGVEHAIRGRYCAYSNNIVIVGDWQNGKIYQLDQTNFTDNNSPIKRVRSFPAQMDEQSNNRVFYREFVVDIQTGSDLNPSDEPQLTLRWSDNRGANWSQPIMQSLGKTGQYNTNMQFYRLGYGRGRIFEISTSSSAQIVLAGAFVDIIVSKS
jgi:hypothetical protein